MEAALRTRQGFWTTSDANTRYAAVAAIVFALGAMAELARVATGVPWAGLPLWASNAFGLVLAVLWTGAGVSLLARRRSTTFAKAAWLAAIAGPLSLFAHGLVTYATGADAGALYAAGAVIAGFATKRTFSNGEYTRLRAAVLGSEPAQCATPSGAMDSGACAVPIASTDPAPPPTLPSRNAMLDWRGGDSACC